MGGREEEGMADIQVIRDSAIVMFAIIWGENEGCRSKRDTWPPNPSLEQTQRQLAALESTGRPSAAHVS